MDLQVLTVLEGAIVLPHRAVFLFWVWIAFPTFTCLGSTTIEGLHTF